MEIGEAGEEEGEMGTALQTLHRKRAFLEAFSETGIITAACRASGVARHMVYGWQEIDPEFTAAFHTAQSVSTELLEREMLRRGVEGVEKPRWDSKGNYIGSVREYSDNLLMFAIKARKPDQYRDNSKIEHTGSIDLGTIGELLQGHDAKRA